MAKPKEYKSFLGQTSTFKLDRFATKKIKCSATEQPHLELKIGTYFRLGSQFFFRPFFGQT
jgi:hypothetical protein